MGRRCSDERWSLPALLYFLRSANGLNAAKLRQIDDLPTFWDNFPLLLFLCTFNRQKRQMSHLPLLCGKWAICRAFVIQNRRFADFADPLLRQFLSYFFCSYIDSAKTANDSFAATLRQMIDLPRFCYTKWAICRLCRFLDKIVILILVFIWNYGFYKHWWYFILILDTLQPPLPPLLPHTPPKIMKAHLRA